MKDQDKIRTGLNPMATAIMGIVVGAGAVAVGAVALLRDKKKCEKVKNALTNVEGKIADGKEKAIKIANLAQDSWDQAIKEEKKASHTK